MIFFTQNWKDVHPDARSGAFLRTTPQKKQGGSTGRLCSSPFRPGTYLLLKAKEGSQNFFSVFNASHRPIDRICPKS
jgi:hypothetical protein